MDSSLIRDGMTVYSADDKKLGRIVRQDDSGLVVEKGHFFKRDYDIALEDIDRVEDEQVWLRLTEGELEAEQESAGEAERAAARPAGRPPRESVIVAEEVFVAGPLRDVEDDSAVPSPPRGGKRGS